MKMSLEVRVESAIALLNKIADEYEPTVFANSFGAEDMVLTDLIARHVSRIGIISLDTGRLHQETYDLMQKTAEHYGICIQVFFPRHDLVEGYLAEHGSNAFYGSVELRKQCCNIRKVEPLKRALAGKKAWITGLRREQAPTRSDLAVSAFDEANGLQKFNPLLDWSLDEVWGYIREHGVPYNALHDRSFPSIGCAPCTRAVAMVEDIRAGRWWWESPATKECGLHVVAAMKKAA
ncbi:phosphoadenylyl-sulfate reductase [Sulfuricella sp.]|uniref:phosphoadenylyl-sulfate reductase n=1 Tax=Sulfuricella sp. TaxID=2099377 RepID=UPI0039C9596A